MIAPEPQLAKSAFLSLFNSLQIFLLLGAAITTAGIMAAGLSLLRRRADALTLWFAAFATLYGLHLIIEYQPMWWLGARAPFLDRFGFALGLIDLIPALFFFDALNLLGSLGRYLRNITWPLLTALAVITLIYGYIEFVDNAGGMLVLAALIVLVVAVLRIKSPGRDAAIIRWGVLLFGACAIYNGIARLLPHYFNIEPFSFVVLLVCLGIVVGRRTLAQEQELSIIQKELEIARSIQLSILPADFPASPSFRVAARYLPMTSVAGDFYDYLAVDNAQAGLLVADVSGHGVPAALIASMVKLAATAQAANAANPSQLLSGMNAALLGHTQSQFVTAAYVHLDTIKGELRYAAAAHPAMLLLRDSQVTRFGDNGLMLAAFSFAEYTTTSHPLIAGDRLLLYTDGVLEAINSQQEEFGEERLCDLLKNTSEFSAAATADSIVSAVQEWAPLQTDDLTVIVCDVLPRSADNAATPATYPKRELLGEP